MQGFPKYGPSRSLVWPAVLFQKIQGLSDEHLKSLLMIGTINFEPQLDVILSERHQFCVSHSNEKQC